MFLSCLVRFALFLFGWLVVVVVSGNVVNVSLHKGVLVIASLALFLSSGFGFRASGLGVGFRVRVSGFGFRVLFVWVLGFGFRVRDSGFGFQVSGFGFRISGFDSRASGFRFRVGFIFRFYGLLLGFMVYLGKVLFAQATHWFVCLSRLVTLGLMFSCLACLVRPALFLFVGCH